MMQMSSVQMAEDPRSAGAGVGVAGLGKARTYGRSDRDDCVDASAFAEVVLVSAPAHVCALWKWWKVLGSASLDKPL